MLRVLHICPCLPFHNLNIGSPALFLQLPTLMEVVGIGCTGWFIYRYVLFKVNSKLPGVLIFLNDARGMLLI